MSATKMQFRCGHDGCGKVFSTKGILKTHVTGVHEKKKPHKCDHDGCSKAFAQKMQLERHVEAIHENKKQHKCDHDGCGKFFSTKNSLKNHVEAVHEKLKPHKCDHDGCGKAFARERDLRNHVTAVHEKKKPHKCDHDGCGKAFARERDLRNHVAAVHEGLKPHKCTYGDCGKAFAWPGQLKRHVETVHIVDLRNLQSSVLNDFNGARNQELSNATPLPVVAVYPHAVKVKVEVEVKVEEVGEENSTLAPPGSASVQPTMASRVFRAPTGPEDSPALRALDDARTHDVTRATDEAPNAAARVTDGNSTNTNSGVKRASADTPIPERATKTRRVTEGEGGQEPTVLPPLTTAANKPRAKAASGRHASTLQSRVLNDYNGARNQDLSNATPLPVVAVYMYPRRLREVKLEEVERG